MSVEKNVNCHLICRIAVTNVSATTVQFVQASESSTVQYLEVSIILVLVCINAIELKINMGIYTVSNINYNLNLHACWFYMDLFL